MHGNNKNETECGFFFSSQNFNCHKFFFFFSSSLFGTLTQFISLRRSTDAAQSLKSSACGLICRDVH